MIIFWILFYLFFPALTIYVCERIKILGRVGVILVLYFIGIIVANLFIFPFEEIADKLSGIQNALTSITIPLALPLILFSSNLKKLPLKSATASIIIGVVAITITIISGYFIFAPASGNPEFNKISGLLVGVYTGGTPNLAALKMMLDVDEATYILINSFDVIVSFSYLVFLMTFGIKLFRKFLPFEKKNTTNIDTDYSTAELSDSIYHDIFTKKNLLPTIGAIGLSIAITGISLGISYLLTGGISMIVLILSLTTLAVAFSFLPKIKKAEKSYDTGMYLVLIFSLVIASMVNISEINFIEGFWMFIYIVYAIFISLTIQVILAKIFKIDADITVITSVAMINSPLFVPLIADSMKNKQVIIVGISIGIIGYAIGNYLGVIVASIL